MSGGLPSYQRTIDSAFSREAEELAANYFLRGADVTYAVESRRYGCTLVSLDDEQCLRLDSMLTIQTLVGALAAITAETS
ncbi:hypothetical protein EYB53_020600 [Candidatus Chloroploca sp. M-50]|uniref:Uncharacterized protein n=1 Tax=Candidatus Chloroploca mongolica TaxID=2528176 RepID=A0ABS4DF95_9CHLR|nr:hypothetical protein [Candidatus Chloroploca mongolica]MBP1468125.1 hypothetical protein [Candidatus Chloroploca mongolica]